MSYVQIRPFLLRTLDRLDGLHHLLEQQRPVPRPGVRVGFALPWFKCYRIGHSEASLFVRLSRYDPYRAHDGLAGCRGTERVVILKTLRTETYVGSNGN